MTTKTNRTNKLDKVPQTQFVTQKHGLPAWCKYSTAFCLVALEQAWTSGLSRKNRKSRTRHLVSALYAELLKRTANSSLCRTVERSRALLWHHELSRGRYTQLLDYVSCISCRFCLLKGDMLLRTAQSHYRSAHRNLSWSRVHLPSRSGQGLHRYGGACCTFTTKGRLLKEEYVDAVERSAQSSKGIILSATDKVRSAGEKDVTAASESRNKKPAALLSETTVTSKEQRKVDWAIMKEMAKYLWPKVGSNWLLLGA